MATEHIPDNGFSLDQRIEDAVTRAFSAGVDSRRFIDVTRVPLLCQSIVEINNKMDKMVTQDQFWPVKTLVYGLLGLLLTGLVLFVGIQITHQQVAVPVTHQ